MGTGSQSTYWRPLAADEPKHAPDVLAGDSPPDDFCNTALPGASATSPGMIAV
jgi:hypothetical protein